MADASLSIELIDKGPPQPGPARIPGAQPVGPAALPGLTEFTRGLSTLGTTFGQLTKPGPAVPMPPPAPMFPPTPLGPAGPLTLGPGPIAVQDEQLYAGLARLSFPAPVAVQPPLTAPAPAGPAPGPVQVSPTPAPGPLLPAPVNVQVPPGPAPVMPSPAPVLNPLSGLPSPLPVLDAAVLAALGRLSFPAPVAIPPAAGPIQPPPAVQVPPTPAPVIPPAVPGPAVPSPAAPAGPAFTLPVPVLTFDMTVANALTNLTGKLAGPAAAGPAGSPALGPLASLPVPLLVFDSATANAVNRLGSGPLFGGAGAAPTQGPTSAPDDKTPTGGGTGLGGLGPAAASATQGVLGLSTAITRSDIGGVMRGFADLAKMLPGVGGAVGGFIGGVMGLSDAAEASARQMAQFNGNLAAQLASLDIERMERQIARANNPEIATQAVSNVQARQQFEEKIQAMIDQALPTILQVGTAALEFFQFIGPAFQMILDVLNSTIGALQQGVNWVLGNGPETMRSLRQIEINTNPPADAPNMDAWMSEIFGLADPNRTAPRGTIFQAGHQTGNQSLPVVGPSPVSFPGL